MASKNYQLSEVTYDSLLTGVLIGYEEFEFDRRTGKFLELIRSDGHILMVHEERRLTLTGKAESEIEKLSKELKEKTGFQIN